VKVRDITAYVETNGTLVLEDHEIAVPIHGSYAEIRRFLQAMIEQLDEHKATAPEPNGTQLELF
jgi:hypothetical protein